MTNAKVYIFNRENAIVNYYQRALTVYVDNGFEKEQNVVPK